MTDRAFRLQRTVRENVVELMRVMGTVEDHLSLRGFARQINGRHPTKEVDYKMVERWTREIDPLEPDVVSIAIMADLAGVSFEEFALGKGATWRTVAESASGGVSLQVAESDDEATEAGELVAVPAPHPRRGGIRGAAKPKARRKGQR